MSATKVEKYYWSEISTIPNLAGIYAWYYSPELTDFDIDNAIREINILKQDGATEQVSALVRSLLDERLFRYFQESPYETRLEGQLKPVYFGQLHHQVGISQSLISRIVEDPERLRTIRGVLDISAPMFASPLYIGMSDKLRSRLNKHKSLIERFRDRHTRDSNRDQSDDAGFAKQIAQRRIPPERLFVCTCVISSDENTHVDIENILNRIYYPVLGRN